MKCFGIKGKILSLTALLLSACEGGVSIAGSDSAPVMNFPVQGPPAGGVEITNMSAGILPPGISASAGKNDFLFGKLAFLSLGPAATIDSLRLTITGSVNDSDTANFELWQEGQPLCSGAGKVVGAETTLDLTKCPIMLTAGNQSIISVSAQIVSGVKHYVQPSIASAAAVSAHDLSGRSIPVTLATGAWPLPLSYVTIDSGSTTVKPAASFTSQEIITTTAQDQTMAVFEQSIRGEDITESGFTFDFIFGGALTSLDLSNLRVIDSAHGSIAPVVSPIPPSKQYSGLNLVQASGSTPTESVTATFRSGAQGTVQVCIHNITALGATSLAPITFPDTVCGAVMSVHP